MNTPRAAAILILGTSSLGCIAGGCATQAARREPTVAAPALADHLDELVSYMSGSFASTEQSEQDKAFFDIRLHMHPIWPHRTDGRWLYVEQAMATTLDQPYRQRVYQVTSLGNESYRSAVFELGDHPLDFAGAWVSPEKLAKLSHDQLVPRDGCSITLHRTTNGVYTGSTNAGDCPSSRSGATYATSEVTIGPDQMISWDRGFDAAGKQVWGATKGGYIFKKQGR